jgi:hypothetical protein
MAPNGRAFSEATVLATDTRQPMRLHVLAVIALAALACTRFGAVYPPRPAPSQSPADADPSPSRVVAHLSIASEALRASIEDAAPRTGDGTFPLLGADRRFTWSRDAIDLTFASGRLVLRTKVRASIVLPLHAVDLPFTLRIDAEPVISRDYALKLQSIDVHVTSDDRRVAFADRVAGVYDAIAAPIAAQLRALRYDLTPLLGEASTRVAQPIEFAVGDAHGCATLRLLSVEAGPTIIADGLEKDIALVVAPAVTLPCEPGESGDSGLAASSLPPLENVATIVPGPFTVTVPIAARYEELTRAMSAAFTNGKLFFSTQYPGLYLESPELYESQGAIVLKLHLSGPVNAMGIDATLDGDLFLTGHPAVVDNELTIPDLEPTIETRSFLLSLKAMTDGDRIRDQARAALRLDIGERLRPVREKLSSDLTFGDARGCFRGDVDRVEVTGVHAHASYLRVYVQVTARARAAVPCDGLK